MADIFFSPQLLQTSMAKTLAAFRRTVRKLLVSRPCTTLEQVEILVWATFLYFPKYVQATTSTLANFSSELGRLITPKAQSLQNQVTSV